MPSKIQRVPNGLLAALSAVGTGINPSILSDVVTVTLDGLDWYLPRLETGQTSAAGISAIGGSVDLAVPSSEFWFLRWVSGALIGSAAGSVLRGSISMRTVAGQPFVTLANSGAAVTATAANDQVQWGSVLEVVLPPGSVLRTELDQPTAVGTATVQIHALFNRVPTS